jgi:hypothetical protein
MQPDRTKKKRNAEIAVLAMLILAGLSLWYYYGRPPAQAARVSTVAANYRPINVENLQIHWERLQETQNTVYKPSPRDIFSRELPPPPPKPVHVPGPGDTGYIAPPPPPPPPPPQLPLKYFGEGKAQSGSGRCAFLTDGDAVHVVFEGDTVLGRYRILKINHLSLEFEEIGSGRHGTAKLEDEGPPV